MLLRVDDDELRPYCQSESSGFIILEPQGRRRGDHRWQLDLAYVESWVLRLGLRPPWAEVQRPLEPR